MFKYTLPGVDGGPREEVIDDVEVAGEGGLVEEWGTVYEGLNSLVRVNIITIYLYAHLDIWGRCLDALWASTLAETLPAFH